MTLFPSSLAGLTTVTSGQLVRCQSGFGLRLWQCGTFMGNPSPFEHGCRLPPSGLIPFAYSWAAGARFHQNCDQRPLQSR